MKRVATVLLVLATVMAVQGAPENSEPTNIEDSECYDCHKVGGEGEGPILQEVFRIFMSDKVFKAEGATLQPGSPLELTFDIHNWWTAEMQGFAGFIDISGASSLSFEPPRDPVTKSATGALPEYEPAAFYQGEERTFRVTAGVNAGGTDVDFVMTPAEGSDTDLIMRIWAPGTNPDVTPPLVEVNQGGNGEPETFTLRGDPVAGGNYIVEAAEEPSQFSPAVGMFDSVEFDVEWTLEYKFEAGDPVRAGGTLVVLDGQEESLPQTTEVTWSLNVVNNISTEQRIRVYMESVAFYDHPPQFQAVDEWLYWNDVEYFILPQADGTFAIERVTPDGDRVPEFIVGDQVIEVASEPEGPDLTAEVDAPLDIAAEVIGYAAGILLILSLLTGGAFGNWSRKLQQFLVYRRAKKRVAFHNVISYGLILAALAHMVLFLVEPKYPWTVGFFLGMVSILGMVMSGVTGAFQKGMVRSMGHESWRWMHYLSFVFAFAGALLHILLDGIHFAEFQQAVEWVDPVAPVLDSLFTGEAATSDS